ncbi:RNA polymerase sigma-70 factor (sigma-E family) [Actinoplanes lutulentus]|uniref:RNA polymerase sigma-70 factor (Sigma-E family) n=2 Tax=Actinoplanes lutulentus TaxID=1287878 RepID=A0A327Z9R2_9ACTN|nr:SigE family RNA polymerase sigma factor [Actinoplanes lutulentus]MBB2948467.1 RNA polymerase sigma-70 factor (sigma-E family) [Actinoplanes lutulentus]RAK34501.1 RNA polymerase sigma-70 factor (sigma-E family) [Actinoplanes lutulentus]
MVDVDEYREYVAGRMDGWRRTAYLLCGDWHAADDLVSIALVKLYRHWGKVSTVEHPDAYVRQILVRTMLNERRRSWRREHPVTTVPDRVAAAGGPESVADRQMFVALLGELPPRRRAVLVLRYFCDLSVEETAAQLGCSTGTVKSQTARALDSLRTRLGGAVVVEEV